MYSFPKLSKLQQIQIPWWLTHKVSAHKMQETQIQSLGQKDPLEKSPMSHVN